MQLIRELILYKFKLDHNTTKAIKTICYAKDDGVIDQMVQEIFQEPWWSDMVR